MAPYGRDDAAQQRVAGGRARRVEHPAQVGLEGVQHGEPVVRARGVEAEVAGVVAAGCEIAVADVVDEAGVAVDGHQVVAPGAWQEEGGDGEVLTRRLVERGTRGVPGLPLGGARHLGPPSAGTARPSRSWRSTVIAVTSPVLHCRPKHPISDTPRGLATGIPPIWADPRTISRGLRTYRRSCHESAPLQLTLYNAHGRAGAPRARRQQHGSLQPSAMPRDLTEV